MKLFMFLKPGAGTVKLSFDFEQVYELQEKALAKE